MAQVTVQQLAEVVGASPERLLTQMKEAGLPHSEASETVSDEDKQTLLAYLKRSHGESNDATTRITVKRKKLSTLRTPGSQGKRTVNVEVRKKRTYVKRDPQELEQEAAAAAAAAEAAEEAVEAAPAQPEVEAPAPEVVAAPEPKPEDDPLTAELTPEEEAKLDPEILRQRAAARRKKQEAEEAAARAAAVEARKAEQEREEAEAAARKANEKAKEGVKRPKRLHEAPSPSSNEDHNRKRPGGRLGRNAPAGRGKQRGHNLSLADLDSETGGGRRRGGRKKIKATHAEHSKHGFELPN